MTTKTKKEKKSFKKVNSKGKEKKVKTDISKILMTEKVTASEKVKLEKFIIGYLEKKRYTKDNIVRGLAKRYSLLRRIVLKAIRKEKSQKIIVNSLLKDIPNLKEREIIDSRIKTYFKKGNSNLNLPYILTSKDTSKKVTELELIKK